MSLREKPTTSDLIFFHLIFVFILHEKHQKGGRILLDAWAFRVHFLKSPVVGVGRGTRLGQQAVPLISPSFFVVHTVHFPHFTKAHKAH